MKLILCLVTIVSILSAAEIFNFSNQLHKTIKKDREKIVLSLENKYTQDNIKYLVVPNLNDYLDIYDKLFLELNVTASEDELSDILQGTSPFGVFMYNTTLYKKSIQKHTYISDQAPDLVPVLEFIQMKVLNDTVQISKNISNLLFATYHLNILLNSIEINNKRSCTILLDYPKNLLEKFVKVLEANVKTSFFGEIKEINYSDFPLINRKDLTLNIVKSIDTKISQIMQKNTQELLKKIKISQSDFMKQYKNELSKEKEKLDYLKEKYQNRNGSLDELKIFYIRLYTYKINFLALKLLEKMYETNAIYKNIFNECAVYHSSIVDECIKGDSLL